MPALDYPTDYSSLGTTTNLNWSDMDFLKKQMGGGETSQSENMQQGTTGSEQKQGGGGFLGGIGDKFNSAAGGGKESEKNEDYLDKGTWANRSPSI